MWSSSLLVTLLSRISLSLLLFYRISSVCLALHACAPRASLASLARALRALWHVDRFGSIVALLGAILGRLGAILARFGAILGRLG